MISYRPEIDGLRAVAVLIVILFHAGFELFSGGFVGVDVFFVISGYLITTIILAHKANKTFSIFDFYERRAIRILPAFFFITTICILAAYLWLLPNDMKDFSKSLIAASVFSSNIHFFRQSGYFDNAAELKPLIHTWSLAVEEQYYIIFPLLLLVIWRFAKQWTIAALTLLTVLSFALAQWGSYNKPAAAFYLLPTRGWEIATGALVALYSPHFSKLQLHRTLQEIGSLVGLSVILYAALFYSKATPFPGVYALAPVLGTALIILFATSSTAVGRLLSTKVFVSTGLVSYSAYLWHQPLFAFFRHRDTAVDNLGIYIVLSLISFLLAYLTWRYIETPFRKKVLNRLKILTVFFCFTGFFILFGIYGVHDGYKNRYDQSLHGLLDAFDRDLQTNYVISSYNDHAKKIEIGITEAVKRY